jgi:hypothetical protein
MRQHTDELMMTDRAAFLSTIDEVSCTYKTVYVTEDDIPELGLLLISVGVQ